MPDAVKDGPDCCQRINLLQKRFGYCRPQPRQLIQVFVFTALGYTPLSASSLTLLLPAPHTRSPTLVVQPPCTCSPITRSQAHLSHTPMLSQHSQQPQNSYTTSYRKNTAGSLQYIKKKKLAKVILTPKCCIYNILYLCCLHCRWVCVSWICRCCASCGRSMRPFRSTRAPRCCPRPPSALKTDTLTRRKRREWRKKRRRRESCHNLRRQRLCLCLCLGLHPAATPGTSGSKTPSKSCKCGREETCDTQSTLYIFIYISQWASYVPYWFQDI